MVDVGGSEHTIGGGSCGVVVYVAGDDGCVTVDVREYGDGVDACM